MESYRIHRRRHLFSTITDDTVEEAIASSCKKRPSSSLYNENEDYRRAYDEAQSIVQLHHNNVMRAANAW